MRKPSNPFLLTGYHSPAYFCDRETELAWLMDQFDNERNAVLHSWRRVGKTALLRHFFHTLGEKRKADCVYVDLLGTASPEDAQRRVAEALLHQWAEPTKPLGKRIIQLVSSIGATIGFDSQSGTPQLTFGLAANSSVSANFEAMGRFLQENPKPVVICLDEFQQVALYPTSAEAMFRTWAQQFPMVRFVYSGSHRHMMISMFSEKARPFYRSAQVLALDTLDPGTYQSFILQLFKKEKRVIRKEIIDQVFLWTRMQTYYVQLICNKLFAKDLEANTNQLIEIFDEVIQQEIPVFAAYQSLMSEFQWRLLVAIARAESVRNPMSKEFLSAHDLGAASSVRTALTALEKKEFVIRQNEQYTLHDTLLMRWLQRL